MKYRIEQAVLKAVFSFFSSLEPARRLRWGREAGRIWYAVDGKHRRIAVENIMRGLELDRERAEEVARSTFENIGCNLAEFSAFDKIEELRKNVTIEGLEHLTAALEKGRGAFLVSGHIGNWELTGAVLSQKVPMTVVARPMKNPLSEELIRERRESAGMTVIGHRNSTRPILRKLGKGETITVLLDQSASYREAVFVPFLGRPAAVNFGLALLAAKSGAPVLPGFSVRGEGLTHRAVIGPPVELVRLPDRQEELGVNTARITAVLEEHIRRYPDQWFWVHNRWKNQPRPGERTYTP
jgi:KDO2-lipid IV(A) lauroyltransferase